MDPNPLHPKLIPLLASAAPQKWGKSATTSLANRLQTLNRNVALDASRPVAEFILSSTEPYHALLATTPSVTLLHHIQTQVIEVDPAIVDFYARLHETGVPYVLKVVSVASPQPLRVHPDAPTTDRLAERMGFERPVARPVMLIALRDVDALFGFQSAADIVTELSRVPEFADAVGRPQTDHFVHVVKTSRPTPDHIRELMSSLLAQTDEFIADCLARAAKRLNQMPKDAVTDNDRQLISLQELYPDDPMCFAIYFLNRVKMSPGNAVFIHTREPYCVLQGELLEASTCSDAVVHGGLTKDNVRAFDFLDSLSYDDSPVEVSDGERFSNYGVSYVPPVPHYQLLDFKLPDGASQQMVETLAPSILLVLEGEGLITVDGESQYLPLRTGSALYLNPQTSFLVYAREALNSVLHFVQIGVNESAAPSSSSSCAIM